MLSYVMHLLGQADHYRVQAEHAKQVVDEASGLYLCFYESGVILIQSGLQQDTEGLKRYDEIIDSIPERLKKLRTLAGRNKTQLKEIGKVEEMLNSQSLPLLKEIRDAVDANRGSVASFLEFGKRRAELTDAVAELRRLMKSYSASQEKIAKQSPVEAQKAREAANQVIYWIMGFNGVIALWVGYVFSRRIVRRVEILSDNSNRIVRGDELNEPLSGNDEIAQLDRSFHYMSQQLSEAVRKEQTIVQNAADIIMTMDGHNQITSVSPACVKNWGYEPDELIGMRCINLVVEDDLEATVAAFSAQREREETHSFDNRVKRRDGTICDARWSINWSKSERSLFCVVHDVSRQKDLERLKQEFVRMVSHDLRTPLNSVSNLMELLEMDMYGELSEGGHKRIIAAQQDIGRLMRLINDLLDFEKMEEGKMQLDQQDTAISDIFDQSIEAVRGIAEKKHIEVEKSETSYNLYCDRDRIVQVIVNLVSNSVKFSEENSTISLNAEMLPDAKLISITDRGRGIPSDKIATIFDRFTQVEIDDAKVKGGSGLGLAICKMIVEAHGGEIGVDSVEGEGSTFWFKIPSFQVVLEDDEDG